MMGTVVQATGVIVVGYAIFYEIKHHAKIGYILMTVGALIFAIGEKMR